MKSNEPYHPAKSRGNVYSGANMREEFTKNAMLGLLSNASLPPVQDLASKDLTKAQTAKTWIAETAKSIADEMIRTLKL